MHKGKLFLISFLLTTTVVSALYFKDRPKQRSVLPELVYVDTHVYITSQLETKNIAALRKRRGVHTIIDIRPDGEAKDQTPSSEIEAEAKANKMRFHYIPVPHESIPESAVTALDHALSEDPASIVLYCRTGRRAARLFALVQASSPDGPKAEAILKMVSDAGFSADDLKEDIDQRIAHRQGAPAANAQP